MKKLIWIISIGTVVFIAVWMGVKMAEDKDIVVETAIVTKRDIVETVSASGKIQPEVEVKISSDVSGEIIELFVKEGDRVKKGDLLCRIKPDIYESALERVNAGVNSSKATMENTLAQLEQAKANLTATESVYARNKKLFEQNAISAQEFENIRAQYESAKATVKAAQETVRGAEFNITSAEASLKEASENLHKTMIYAPVDGTVSKLNVEKGERVLGVNSLQGTEIMRLADLNEMEVSVDVNENDIIRVKKGDPCWIEVGAYPNRKFKGMVTEVANSANVSLTQTDQVTNFVVKIRVLQESYKDLLNGVSAPFRPGMTAEVEVQTRSELAVLSVPIQCVTTRMDSVMQKQKNMGDDGEVKIIDEKEEQLLAKKELQSKKELVFLLVNGEASKREVKTGIQNDDFIQILSGLKEGEEVISGPYSVVSRTLKDKDKVEKSMEKKGQP